MSAHKEKLIDATVLLQCKDDHKTCTSLRNALVELDDVMEAYLTRTSVFDKKFCVGGTIMSTSSRIKALETQIQKLRNEQKKIIPIEAAAIVQGMT